MREIAGEVGAHPHTVYEWMCKHQIPRRSLSDSNYLVSSKTKPPFRPKKQLTTRDEKLKIAGIMLYWAEGFLSAKATGVDFANSNPEMIRVFLKFLRRVCGISESRLRVYLYRHGSPLEAEVSCRFWSRITAIPLSQFSRPYIRDGNPHFSGRIMANGLIHIRYADKRLLQLIRSWISEYSTEQTSRADTKVAKWACL